MHIIDARDSKPTIRVKQTRNNVAVLTMSRQLGDAGIVAISLKGKVIAMGNDFESFIRFLETRHSKENNLTIYRQSDVGFLASNNGAT